MQKQWLRVVLLGLFALLVISACIPQQQSTVSGQVMDVDGMPLAGVTVSATGVTAVSDTGGMFTLEGVIAAERVAVDFELEGYARTQGIVSLLRAGDSDKCREGGKHHHLSHKKTKRCRHHRWYMPTTQEVIPEVTMVKTMLQQGTVHTIDGTMGGVVVEGGFKVSIPDDSLNVTGDVDVVITPVDVSTNQINGVPGDFTALTAVGESVTIESFSMADFTLTQNGEPVNLKEGATAEIELLLPENTMLVSGDVKPLWYYDMDSGLWVEEGTGLVGDSTLMPGRLAVFATVQHFTYWNSDQVANQTAVSGRVVDNDGNPLGGVSVEGYGVDYAGHSYAIATDAAGNYCIQIKTSATSELTASLSLSGLIVSSESVLVTANATESTCAGGATQSVPDIVLSTGLSCVSGTVVDGASQPVEGATVFTTAGSYTTTAADGTYQVPVPAESAISVFTPGYPVVAATSPAEGDPCVEVNLAPGNSTGDTACLAGMVYQCDISNPREGVGVEVYDLNNNLFGNAISDINGQYCIDSLPANTDVNIGEGTSGNGIFGIGSLVNTGPGGSTCAANNCTAVSPLDVWCY